MAQKKKSDSSNNDDSAKIKEEKLQMVLSTLTFLSEQCNKSLFRLSYAKLKRKIAQNEVDTERNRVKLFKKRIVSEIEKNLELLKGANPNDFYIETDEE